MRRRKKSKTKKRIIVFLAIFLFVLSLIGILLSPIFELKKISLYGNKEISSEELEKSIKSVNILLMTTNGLKDKLLKEFPKISEVRIEKNIFKRTIAITITERKSLGIICKAEKSSPVETTKDGETIKNCFYIDKNGVIFEDAPQTSGSLVLLIKDFSSEEFSLGKKIFEEQIINSIVEIRENLTSSTNIKIDWFENRTIPPKELKLVTSKGWYILFDSTRDIKKQLSILKTALSEKIKTTDNLEYIDLRIENRIYYK
ncbi:MAG: FtsQ-type POTRA domain-containing protein [bacterium]|nr:FtsQ-type POTRA domain-containing protein [bacterium]